MIMSFEGYQEALESQKEKEQDLKSMQSKINTMESQLQTLISALASIKDQNQINQTAQMLYKSGILNNP
jgi:DNA repair exonuclease SbcCD ATPase subunit